MKFNSMKFKIVNKKNVKIELKTWKAKNKSDKPKHINYLLPKGLGLHPTLKKC
jgi:hypothetical protein